MTRERGGRNDEFPTFSATVMGSAMPRSAPRIVGVPFPIPDPGHDLVALHRFRRSARRREPLTLERHPDDLPKTGLFTEPVRVDSIRVLDPETLDDGTRRVTFLVEIRDADDKRCSQFSVEAHVTGPDRARTVSGATDLLGRIRFRTTGGGGQYQVEVTDVGAGGVRWDPEAGPTTAQTTLP